MRTPLNPVQDKYTEIEAAEALGISVPRLHMILDRFVFNDGKPKPSHLIFRSTDLMMIEFWSRQMSKSKVLRMPRQYTT